MGTGKRKKTRFKTVVVRAEDSAACAIELPFDPREVFGKVRAPVRVTIGRHTFRSTTARMGGRDFVPLNKANREAAGVEGGDRVTVVMELDTAPRRVEPPDDLKRALRRRAGALAAWDRLSYTHQREHVEAIEEAKRPETRERRVARAIEMLLR